MSLKKTLAGMLAGSVVAGMALIAVAAPASANDESPVVPGAIYFFSTAGALASQTPSTQIFGGSGTARPWVTLTTENACPAGTNNLQSYVRIPQVGVAEDLWDQVPMGAPATAQDADGRFYTTTTLQADRMTKPQVLAYNLANGGSGTFPFISVCKDIAGTTLASFRTTVAVSGTTSTDIAWTFATPAITLASTTTLTASAATVEAGTAVDLTATVAPAGANGDVEFFAGAVSLGTATPAAGVATLSTSALPVGINAVTAVFAGGNGYGASTSAPVSVEVTPVAARTTTTTLVVTPDSGPAYQAVTLTSTVVASSGAANGTVTFKDGTTSLGSVTVTAGVVPTFTTNVLGAGAHSLVAEFVGTAPYGNSASAAVAATYTLVGAVDEQTVTVEIPAGTISITTPYTPAAPLALGVATLDPSDSTFSASAPFNDIVITDTRAGNLGFTASVVSGAFVGATGSFPGLHAGLTGLTPVQVVGNALQASNVVVTNHAPFTDGLDVPKVFATYAAGQSVGTAAMYGTFGVDQVPTSVAPGLYTATVTFTAV
ncbi:Ig-like domain-containing protein [Actinotalea sp.]|uniref:Ig-like domain-containing protein n=1 Tax=Actinotalea sp. TaxID=1872145 RepID=UPI002B53783A|nr:Ig-like domain-containing protein [Actinotalea sp.]HQY32730.1 Ig-like domain-containing protein [Actinotalea sp.]HRA50286.1 Ig-like domain-containing protein [Actinotalea sp.]